MKEIHERGPYQRARKGTHSLDEVWGTPAAATPILIAYINKGAGIGDGHNFELRRDPKTGKDRPSFTAETAERIVGSLSDDPKDIRLEERDGVTWIVGRGTLWKFYAPELVDKITADAAQGRALSVSIEALIEKFHMEGDVEVEERYTPLGTTILGDHVAPAVKDARVIALGRGGFAELKVRAASYRENQSKKNWKEGGNLSMNKQAVARLAPKFEGYRIIGWRPEGRELQLYLRRRRPGRGDPGEAQGGKSGCVGGSPRW